MSGELEAAGAMATAGLAAGAIEGREAHGAGEGACLNCGAALAGAYCSQCGQAAHAHRTLSHMFEEVLHGLIHFDTKAWRTLPMLAFRPGTLTRNYIYGKRARYISPLALFLFTIFFMFFVFAFVDVDILRVNATPSPGDARAELVEAREALVAAERELTQARAEPEDQFTGDLQVRLAQQAVELAQAEVERREQALARIETATAPVAIEPPATSAAAPAAGSEPAAPTTEGPFIGVVGNDTVEADLNDGQGTWQDALQNAARNGDLRVNTGFPALDERILHSFENPDLALYKVQQAAYKFSFLLAPISLPFLWLLFVWRRGHTLYDHMVFILYSLSFASLVFVLVALVNDVPWLEWLGAGLLMLGLPAHMFFHLKGAYALGWWSALWRVWFLFLSAILALSVFVIAIIVLGLGG
ncbi:MAG: DUF3667 domain-containing protein [Hyphomonadaceae bacterium]|nr:DUF3667 domain-containing protein [Hyphomonadaceae bacterium]